VWRSSYSRRQGFLIERGDERLVRVLPELVRLPERIAAGGGQGDESGFRSGRRSDLQQATAAEDGEVARESGPLQLKLLGERTQSRRFFEASIVSTKSPMC